MRHGIAISGRRELKFKKSKNKKEITTVYYEYIYIKKSVCLNEFKNTSFI